MPTVDTGENTVIDYEVLPGRHAGDHCPCPADVFGAQVSVRNYRVELSSMEATLFAKDRLVVNKLVYLHLDSEVVDGLVPFVDVWDDQSALFPFHPPRRGDVIVFRYPKDPSRDFVKRVIGLPERRWRYTEALCE